MSDFGLSQGLAVRVPYSDYAAKEIQDQQYLDSLKKQNEALQISKNKLFFDDVDFQNGSNDFDSAIIKQENSKLLEDLGRMTREHPDWATNRSVQAQMKMIKNNYKSTPAILRSTAYIDANKRLQDDLAEAAKNPQFKDVEKLREQTLMRDNYRQYGHPMGKEGFDKEGAMLWTYERPQDLVDLPAVLQKAGSNINRFDVINGKNPGEYLTVPKPEDIRANVAAYKAKHPRDVEIMAKKAGVNTPEQVDALIAQMIGSGFEEKYSPGDPNALWERGMRERELRAKEGKLNPMPNYTPFDDLFDKRKPSGNVSTDVVRKVWNDKPKIRVVGNKGQVADLTGFKMEYDGRYITDSRGRRLLTGSVDVPIETAKQVGIWDGDDEDGGVTDAFLGKAVRRQKETKDGMKTYVKVDYQLPIDPKDGTARQMYNTHSQPSKLVEPLKYEQSTNSQGPTIGQEQDGYKYIGGDPASPDSWKKI